MTSKKLLPADFEQGVADMQAMGPASVGWPKRCAAFTTAFRRANSARHASISAILNI